MYVRGPSHRADAIRYFIAVARAALRVTLEAGAAHVVVGFASIFRVQRHEVKPAARVSSTTWPGNGEKKEFKNVSHQHQH